MDDQDLIWESTKENCREKHKTNVAGYIYIYIYIYNIVIFEGNIHKISRSIRCKKREKYAQKKKKFIQDNIYVIRQFTYVYGVTEISLFLRKNTRCGSTVFSLKTT